MFPGPAEASLPAWAHAMSGQAVCILTFGCTYNEGDSARLREILSSCGSRIVEDPDDARVVILNSCIVIGKTERKMVKILRELEAGGREVWITGCLPAARGELLHAFPGVRVLLPEEIHEVPASVPSCSSGPVTVVQTGSGCLGQCSYCITRLARGRIRSNPVDEILDRIRDAVSGGAVEIRLTGQDLSAYGCDHGTPALPDLLNAIGRMDGHFFVRLGMMNPATAAPVIRKVAEALGNDHFFTFIHLPVQSGSDAVLDLMQRGYTVRRYLDLVDTLRRTVPGIAIATDFIAGFPGESEDDFLASRDLIARIRPDMVNVTRYSYRPGCTASRDDELPDRILKDRSRELISTAYRFLKEKRKEMVGTCSEIVITEQVRDGTVMGRTRSYTGVVVQENLPAGGRYLVEFTSERVHYLIGRVVRRLG